MGIKGGAAILSLSLALAGAGAAPALAGAWPQASGEGQIILTATYDRAARGFDAAWRPRDDIAYAKQETSAFLEFGLTPRLTLVGRAAWQDVTLAGPAGREAKSGFAASEAGLRALLWRGGRGVLSAQGVVVAPGGVENVSDLSLGDGGWDYEGRILYGRSFPLAGGDGFAEAQAGWRMRSGAQPDEATLDLTLGWTHGRWQVLGQAFGLHGAGARPPRRDYDALKLQPSVVRAMGDGMRLQVGAFRTVAGRRIIQETGLFVALWRVF